MKVIRLNEDIQQFNELANDLNELGVDWINNEDYSSALKSLVAGSQQKRDKNKDQTGTNLDNFKKAKEILKLPDGAEKLKKILESPNKVKELNNLFALIEDDNEDAIDDEDATPKVISDKPKPNFDKNNAAIGDYEVAYINSYNIDQRGLIVRDVLNKLTPNTNAGNIINNLYGGQSGEIDRDKVFGQMKGNIIRVEDNNGKVKKLKLDSNEKGYSNYVLTQFIDAFKWKELYKGNTFIKLLNSNVFKKTFENPQTPLMISRRGLKGQTIDLKYAFESLYNAYCANDLDDYANRFGSMKEDEFTDVILSVIDLSKKYDQINKDHDQLAKNINGIKDDNALKKLADNINAEQAKKLILELQKKVQETNKQ
jgi:hypothetical protein